MKHYSLEILTLAASALLLASCAKDLEGGAGNASSLNFSSNVAEIVPVKSGAGASAAGTDSPARFVTLSSADGSKSFRMELSVEPNTSGLGSDSFSGSSKAALQTSVSTFYAKGYDGEDAQWFPQTGTDPVTVTLEGGVKSFTDYKWVDGTSYNFFAYANMPASTDVAEASITKDGVALNYKAVPDGAAGQNDIMLGRYSGIGKGAGTAAMTFYHPMAAVIFKVGTLDASITAIKSISIDGVYASGSTTLAAGTGAPTFTWAPSGTKEVSQTINALPDEGYPIGDPFVLIPQDFATQNVTVNMTVTTDDGDILLTTTLDSGSWEPGKTYTYKVSYMTGPNPKYWVDLGLISENGYPLYISRRNVKKVENGIAYFTDSEDEVYTFPNTSYDVLSDVYTSEDGLSCRHLSADTMLNLFNTEYFDIDRTSSKWTFTRKGTDGKNVKILFDGTYYYAMLPGSSFSDFRIVYDMCAGAGYVSDFHTWTETGFGIKLEYEDINADKIEFSDSFKLYEADPEGSTILISYLPDFSELAQNPIQNNGTYMVGPPDGKTDFILEASCPNGYKYRSFFLLPGFEWSGPCSIGPPFHIFEATLGQKYSVTKGSTVLSFTLDY